MTPPATRRATCSAPGSSPSPSSRASARSRRATSRRVRARALIEDGARQALADLTAVEPYLPGSPCEIQVEYKNTRAPDALRHRQGVERISDRTIISRADTWWDAWRQFFF